MAAARCELSNGIFNALKLPKLGELGC
jgi:hypothetical protein